MEATHFPTNYEKWYDTHEQPATLNKTNAPGLPTLHEQPATLNKTNDPGLPTLSCAKTDGDVYQRRPAANLKEGNGFEALPCCAKKDGHCYQTLAGNPASPRCVACRPVQHENGLPTPQPSDALYPRGAEPSS